MERLDALHILGLTGTPTRSEVMAAQRRLQLKYHPDRHSDARPDERAAFLQESKNVNAAARILLEQPQNEVDESWTASSAEAEHAKDYGVGSQGSTDEYQEEVWEDPDGLLLASMREAAELADWRTVLTSAEELIARESHEYEAHCASAEAYLATERPAYAEAASNRAIGLRGNEDLPWYFKARSQKNQSKFHEALTSIRNALRLCVFRNETYLELERQIRAVIRFSQPPTPSVPRYDWSSPLDEPIYGRTSMQSWRYTTSTPSLGRGLVLVSFAIAMALIAIVLLGEGFSGWSTTLLVVAAILGGLSMRDFLSSELQASAVLLARVVVLAAVGAVALFSSFLAATKESVLVALGLLCLAALLLGLSVRVAKVSQRKLDPDRPSQS